MLRDAINEGRADYTPVNLSEIEELFESGAMPIDVVLIEVSPPEPLRGGASERQHAADVRRQLHSPEPHRRDRGGFSSAM